jgi:uncharacterized RDD family membrane protein YckC
MERPNEASILIFHNHQNPDDCELAADKGKKIKLELLKKAGQKKRKKLSRRFYAFAIDIILITFINKLCLLAIYQEFSNIFPSIFDGKLFQYISNFSAVSFMTVFITYFLTSYYLSNGQSLGKFLFNLKVYNKKGQLSFVDCGLRTLGYFTCYITGSLAFVLPFLRKDQRGLPDFFSKTYVDDNIVNTENVTSLNEHQKLFEEDELLLRKFQL